MKSRIISIDELNTDFIKEEAIPIVKQALEKPDCIVNADSENGCIEIIVSVPNITVKSRDGHEYYGLYIVIQGISHSGGMIYVYIAEKCDEDICKDISVGAYYFYMSLDEIINAALNEANKCDFCKQVVGLSNLVRIAFANKSCPNCEPSARKRLMQQGWCD